MNLESVADALDRAAEAIAQAAHELRGTSQSEAGASAPSAPAPAAPLPALGKCPKHGTPWSVKEGGVSKAGKSYRAFWKCDQKDPDEERGYCAQKPEFGWVKTHPPEQALMDESEVPF